MTSMLVTTHAAPAMLQVYQRITPHLWTPNFSILDELMKALELQDGFRFLPLIWTDLLLFDFLRRTELLEKLLELMAKQQQEVRGEK